ncbi:hypothetical protein RAS1_13460 [Phycisphaerae bacterium RAS1]|nr:hypothetical protein RAS1_13460 [Phycisphaerae bacterium RAS1]
MKPAMKLAWLPLAMCVSEAALGDPILWISDITGRLGTVDVATGQSQVIGPEGVFITDIAFDAQGDLWGVSFTNLYRINTDTGAATLVGATGIPGGNALVFGSDGTLYACGAQSTSLYTVNTTTGAASAIGDVGAQSSGDLAFFAGDMYLSSATDQLVRIDLRPVSGTPIGPFGFHNVFGMARGDDGVLYGVAGTDVFSIDVATGQGTLVVDYAGGALRGASGTAFVLEAPEPGTAVLLLAATLIGLRRRQR